VVIGTPDDLIAQTADELAAAAAVGSGTWLMHLSGSLGLDVLAKARESGARCLALHPLQTFPDVRSALERIPGCWIAITAQDDDGHLFGERLVGDLGGVAFRLADELRPLYHAAAVFASNYVVAASAVAGSLFAAAGVPDPARAMAPLQRASLENVERLGAGRALTGPAVRGDAGTIQRNIEALEEHAPELIHAYVAMARATLDVAERSGRLAGGSRAEVEDVLTAWT
jgi:predicted short-subunit dehydrogenase-like oxidoreductase (DUF2520 family)